MKLFAFFLIISFSFTSCANKKTVSDAKEEVIEISQEKVIEPADMIKKGFVKASIKDFSISDEGCGYLIVLEETKQVLQPIKSLQKKFEKENLKVWIKYRPIRPIAPACKKGIIISLEEIEIRK